MKYTIRILAFGLSLGSFTLALCRIPLAQTAHPPRKVAILVGLSEYTLFQGNMAGIDNLNGCANDVKRLAKKLTAFGWECYSIVSDDQVSSKAVTADRILHSIRAVATRSDDTFLFFYSGHGTRLVDKDYLVPCDARYSGMAAGNPVLVKKYLLSYDTLQSEFQNVSAKKRLLVVNMCRTKPQIQAMAVMPHQTSKKSSPHEYDAIVQGVATGGRNDVTTFSAYSCLPDENSYTDEKADCTVYATSLLSALDSVSSIAGNKLTPNDVFDNVQGYVAAWVQTHPKKKMTPNHALQNIVGDIVLGEVGSVEYQTHLQDAADLYNVRSYKQAHDIYAKAFLLLPTSSVAMRMADCSDHINDWTTAESEYQKALDLDVTLATPAKLIGDHYYDHRKEDPEFSKAKHWFEEASRRNPQWAEPVNGIGNILFDQGDLQPALEAYQKAQTLDKHFADPNNGEGKVYLIQKKYDLAKDKFYGAIQMQPNVAGYHANYAETLYFLKKPDTKDARAEAILAHSLGLTYHHVFDLLHLDFRQSATPG